MPSRRRRAANLPTDGPNQPFATIYLPEDQETVRDPKKLKLLKITAPIAIVVALIGLWFISLYLWTNFSRSNWNKEDYAGAVASYQRQETVTDVFPEPWLAKYNLGSSMVANGELDRGVEYLREAFQGVPKAVVGEQGNIQPFAYECSVRINLSAGIELQGDAAMAADDEYSAKKLYESALEWVTPCEVPSGGGGSGGGGGGSSADQDPDQGEGQGQGEGEGQGGGQDQQDQQGGQGQTGNEAGDRLREKLDQNQDQPDQGEQEQQQGGSGEGQPQEQQQQDPFEGETQDQKERREELQNKNQQQAEREREKDERQNRGLGGGW